MSDNNYMSSSEELTAFLDGELSPEQANSLFYEMAKNPDLQQEMQQLLKMKNTYRNSLATPPEHLKSEILAATGLNGGTWLGDKLAPIGAFLFTGYRSIAVLGSVIAAGLIFLVGVGSDQESSSVSNLEVAEVRNITDDPALTQSGISEFASMINQENMQVSQGLIPKNRDGNPIQRSSNSYANATNGNTVQQEPVDDLISSQNDEALFRFIPIEQSEINPQGMNVKLNEKITKIGFKPQDNYFISGLLDNLSIRISGGNQFLGADYGLAGASPFVRDFSVSGMYNFDRNFSMGIEVGRTNFSHSYDAMVDSELYSVRQQADYAWYGIAGQYTMNPLFTSFRVQPFARLSGGISDIGPIINGTLGIEYPVFEGFKVYTGFNGTTIFYSQDNDSYNASKGSFSVGVVLGL